MTGQSFKPASCQSQPQKIQTDLLVIGSGLAGMWAAVMAREKGVRNVAIVDKGAITDSSQSKMCAGATIYRTRGDNADKWMSELVELQSFLSRQDMLADMLATSESILRSLQSWGLWYKRLPWGATRLPVGGTKYLRMNAMPRYKNQRGGSALVGPLRDRIHNGDIRLFSKIMITDLVMKDNRAVGAVGLHRLRGDLVMFESRAVVLATADCSFRNTGCIGQATGDGYRLAYNAGARLTNMEFLGSNTGSPDFSFEAFADIAAVYGCRFLDAAGRRFMNDYSPLGDRAEPFKVAQAMADEAEKGNGPPFFFDMSGPVWRFILKHVYLKNMSGYMRRIFEAKYRNDPSACKSPQVWAPLIRTIRGGVRTEMDCSCDVHGLFPAGAAQSLDPVGLNGFSTLRVMWSGRQAGETAAGFINNVDSTKPRPNDVKEACAAALSPLTNASGPTADRVMAEMQKLIFPYQVSLKKNATALGQALQTLQNLRENSLPDASADNPHDLVKVHEAKAMALTGELYLQASLARQETRGDHYRGDFPETDNRHWLKWINLSKGSDENPKISYEDVPIWSYPVKLKQK